ncbi:MAG TPA: MFS transporter, partial [Pseudonocardiaceae bacterium]
MLNVETVDRSWLRAGIAVAAVGWGANQFAPLLVMYQARLGLSGATAQATFGLYALGLMPALLVGGLLADRYGRRTVLLPALVASLLAGALLIAGGSTPALLFAGRLVAGIASGAAFSSGAAWVKELAPAETGARRLTVAMTAGFAA